MRDCTRTLQVAGYPGMITSGPHHLLCPITNYNVGCHPTSLQPHWTAVAQRFQVHFATVTRHTLAPSTARESNPTTVSHLQRRRMHPAYIRCLLCPFNHRIAAPCRSLIRHISFSSLIPSGLCVIGLEELPSKISRAGTAPDPESRNFFKSRCECFHDCVLPAERTGF